MLMSYGAGSVGLNLQFANYVFLFDRWWNPAVEDQAINRAHRIGVDRPGHDHAVPHASARSKQRINQILRGEARAVRHGVRRIDHRAAARPVARRNLFAV